MNYKVTYAIDSLDTQPVVKFFDEEYEAIEYLIDPTEYYENQGIQKAYAMNDEQALRRILESEY